MRWRRAVRYLSAEDLVGLVAAAGLDGFDQASLADLDAQECLRALLDRFGCDTVDYLRAKLAVRRGRGDQWAPWSARWVRRS